MIRWKCIVLIVILISCTACSGREDDGKQQETKNKETMQVKHQEEPLLNKLALGEYKRKSLIYLFGESDDFRIRASELELGANKQHDEVYNMGLLISYSNSGIGDNSITSLTFQKHYEGMITNDIDMSTTINQLEERYGQPHFQDASRDLIGYHMKGYYLFAIGTNDIDSLTIYPVTDFDWGSMKAVLDKYHKTQDLSIFFDEVPWDYDFISGESSYSHLSCMSKGFVIEIDEGANNVKVTLYKGIEGYDIDLTAYPEVHVMEKNPIFSQEISRLVDEEVYQHRVKYQGEYSPHGKVKLIELFSMYSGNFIRLYSSDCKQFYKELHDICTYEWIGDEYLLYVKEEASHNEFDNKRRYILAIYDCHRQENINIDIKEQPIKLKSWDDGYIKYTSGDNLGAIKYDLNEEGIIID